MILSVKKKVLVFQILLLALFSWSSTKDHGVYARVPSDRFEFQEDPSNVFVEENFQLSRDKKFENLKLDEGMVDAMKLAACYNATQDIMPRLDPENLLLILPVECNSEKCSSCVQTQSNHENHDRELLTSFSEVVEDNSYNYDDDLEIEVVFHCSSYDRGSSNFTAYYRIEAKRNGSRLLSPESPHMLNLDDNELPKVFLVEQFLDEVWHSNKIITSWLISSTVPSNTNLTLRVTGIVSDEKIYRPTTTTSLNLTINSGRGSRKPENPRVVRVRQNPKETARKDLEILIHWKSGNGFGATCTSSIWVMDMNARTFETQTPLQSFWFQITSQTKKLSFNESYIVHLSEKSDEEDDKTSQPTVLEIRTPTCTTVYGNNFTLCAPSPPTNIKISETSNNSYVISWDPPPYTSNNGVIEQYEMRISKLISYSAKGTLITSKPQHHLISTNIFNSRFSGNTTVFVLSNFTYHGSFELSLRAKTKGGYSPFARVQHHMDGDDQQFLNYLFNQALTRLKLISLSAVGGSSTKLFIGFGVFGFFLFGFIIVIWGRIYYGKRKRDKKRNETFKDPQKESCPMNANYIPETIPKDKFIEPLRLKLLETLGIGNFGVVRKAILQRNNGYEIVVAVKSLREQEENLEETICDKDWAEVKLMLMLQLHPHILCLIGVSLIQRSPSLVMEFCNGGDLLKYLRKIKPSEEYCRNNMSKAVATGFTLGDPTTVVNPEYCSDCRKSTQEVDRFIDFGQQIADGMAYLSKNKIVHRDLAARNVLVNQNDVGSKVLLKISDFGLSRDVYVESIYQKRSNSKLPVRWLALESLQMGEFTTKSDVWSFGITFWEIVTYGGKPYGGLNNWQGVLDHIAEGNRLPQPESCPNDLYNLMMDCWHKTPEHRPTFKELYIQLGQMIRDPRTFEYFQVNSQDPLSQLENDSVRLEVADGMKAPSATFYANLLSNVECVDQEGYQIPTKLFVPHARFVKSTSEHGSLDQAKDTENDSIQKNPKGMLIVNNDTYQHESDSSDTECVKEPENASVPLIKTPSAIYTTRSSSPSPTDLHRNRQSEFEKPVGLKMSSNLYSKCPADPSVVNSQV